MDKHNIFTSKFEKKSSDELRQIINSNDYQMQAKLAAIWILEEREEASEKDKKVASSIEAEREKREASRLSGRRYNTFWRRFFAAFIDGFALWPVGYLLNYLTGSSIGTVVVIANLLNSFSPYIYSVLLHGYYGQTLGKMLMGVKVVDFEDEEAIDLKQAFIRDSIPVALMIILYAYEFIVLSGMDGLDIVTDFATLAPMFFIGLLNFLWVVLEIFSLLFNEKSRAVHDLVAGTVVVRTS